LSLFCASLPQVRSAQLDKEASELRQENETLLKNVEEQKRSAVSSAQVCRWLRHSRQLHCGREAAFAPPCIGAASFLRSMWLWRLARSSCERS
jgi:hypothetical protein